MCGAAHGRSRRNWRALHSESSGTGAPWRRRHQAAAPPLAAAPPSMTVSPPSSLTLCFMGAGNSLPPGLSERGLAARRHPCAWASIMGSSMLPDRLQSGQARPGPRMSQTPAACRHAGGLKRGPQGGDRLMPSHRLPPVSCGVHSFHSFTGGYSSGGSSWWQSLRYCCCGAAGRNTGAGG